MSSAVVVIWQFVVAYVYRSSLFCKWAYAFHVLSESTKSCTSEYIFCLIDWLTVLNRRDSMIIFAVNTVCTAPSCKEQTEKPSKFLIEQIRSSISDIKFRITPRQCSLFFFLIFRTDVFTIPEIVLLISLFIRIIIG